MALPLETTEYKRLYTAEEFMKLSLDPGKRYELVRGVILEMSHPYEEHMLVTDNLYFALSVIVRAKKLGRVLPPGTFKLDIDPERDTVRSPDLTFLTEDKVTWQNKAITVAPDLAVEVYSTNDRPAYYQEKLKDYQIAGWNLVWLIYPPKSSPKSKAGKVEVYHLQQSLRPFLILTMNDKLDGEDVIPGFSMPVKELFQ